MGYYKNICVLFQDDIIFFTSNENKCQLDHPNLQKNPQRKPQAIIFVILLCGECGLR